MSEYQPTLEIDTDGDLIGTVWRHKKRGSTYEIVFDRAALQCSTDEGFEAAFGEEDWIVYRSIRTQASYIRLRQEFLDGRFECLKSDSESREGGG